VTENDGAQSGSRWEHATPAPEPSVAPPPSFTAPSPSLAAPATPRGLPSRLRRRSALAGAAIGLFAVGGLGGFAVGHEVGQSDLTPTGVVQPGDDSGGPGGFGDRPDGDRDGPPFGAPGDGGTGSDDGGTGPDDTRDDA
jgi:hypothetical protein